MKSSAGKIALAGLNDLFQTGGETVQEVPLSELFPFKNHPFQVRYDEAMRKTVEGKRCRYLFGCWTMMKPP